MLDYNESYEQDRAGVYNGQVYYKIHGYYFVRQTSSGGGDYIDRLVYVGTPPAGLVAA